MFVASSLLSKSSLLQECLACGSPDHSHEHADDQGRQLLIVLTRRRSLLDSVAEVNNSIVLPYCFDWKSTCIRNTNVLFDTLFSFHLEKKVEKSDLIAQLPEPVTCYTLLKTQSTRLISISISQYKLKLDQIY
jgi:hypothetical protein